MVVSQSEDLCTDVQHILLNNFDVSMCRQINLFISDYNCITI